MDFAQLIAAREARRNALIAQRDALAAEGQSILDAAAADSNRALTEEEDTRSMGIVTERREISEKITPLDAELAELRTDQAETARLAALSQVITRVAPSPGVVVREERTYSPDKDKRGVQFAVDVARQFLFNDVSAAQRLNQHMVEERAERGELLTARAAGTSAFGGLVVPQYLVDEFAPLARAGRPFADACRHHDLPAEGMTAYLGKLSTGTTVGDQSAENAAVSEQDPDDTLLTITIDTAGGSATLSRQAVERGSGVEDTIVEDLIRAYAVNLDGKILNRATRGLAAVATSITYTSASPTASELYPKLIGGAAAVEAALLDQGLGDTIAFMHSRRWYWLQTQLTSTWPMFGQPGVAAQLGGANYAERYGAGFRGVLPNGTPVVVDNNIVTNLGTGTNQDEIYFGAQSELHLWEDPSAPMLIRAEQPSAKKLGIDLVVYGYYAFTGERRTHAQKVTGTGLVAPTF